MALTPSRMIDLGTSAPDFKLEDTKSGKTLSLSDVKGEFGTLVMFICNHCPFVKHINHQLVRVANDYQSKGVNFVAISSNDVEEYPQDGPAEMARTAKELAYPFPYLYDSSQEVAKAYQAECTPDFFLYNKDSILAYRGQLDGSRPGNSTPVTGSDLRMALDALIERKAVVQEQLPSQGCNIKWRS